MPQHFQTIPVTLYHVALELNFLLLRICMTEFPIVFSGGEFKMFGYSVLVQCNTWAHV